MTRSIKKLEEMECADFFAARLNIRHGFDYQAKLNENEEYNNEFIDAYAISEKLPQLNLQIIAREGALKENFARLREISRHIGKSIVMSHARDMPSEKWIRNAIESKEKRYPSSIQQSLVLLIFAEFGSLFNKKYAQSFF